LLFRTVPSANTLVRRVNENAFASIVQARPCPAFGRPVHLRGSPHRLRPGTSPHALRIPPRDGHPALRRKLLFGQRGITPAFGYSDPHPITGGTSTLLNNALLSAHYGLIRDLPIHRPRSLVALDLELPRILPRRRRGFPKFLENPFESVPRARDSGGSWRPRITVTRMLPSANSRASASATM
jgi:hypothetical protein